jgi:hypothetical protein
MPVAHVGHERNVCAKEIEVTRDILAVHVNCYGLPARKGATIGWGLRLSG